MVGISTARILTDKALQELCGQTCVDWAVSMLAAGHDGRYLAMLASESPPYNHFELADLRDRALAELGAPDLSVAEAVETYVAERFRLALDDETDLIEALRIAKDLCIAHDYHTGLWDFYLLYHAHDTLRDSKEQWYWDGATRKNIMAVIREHAAALVARVHAAAAHRRRA